MHFSTSWKLAFSTQIIIKIKSRSKGFLKLKIFLEEQAQAKVKWT